MPSIKLASGAAVKEIRIWDGAKWVAKSGKIYSGEWQYFIKPILTFSDDFTTINGGRLVSSTAVVGNGLYFDTKISYTLESI